MYLNCHVTSYDHLIEGSCDFIGGSSSRHVKTLISLVTISTVKEMLKVCRLKMFLICHMTSPKHISRAM